ncbi:erythroid differentiation-related factor 1-like isoform X2 [Acropora muricata]|uniref:erythroid differentiation-related factor 1-like isoform X2 n=1 Tax=Acropora muricata TaxID=159855 RepID=UPI0034E4BC9A
MEKEYQNSIMTPERSDSVCKEASLPDNSKSSGTGVSSTAVVKYSAQEILPYNKLQQDTDLNVAPSNWLRDGRFSDVDHIRRDPVEFSSFGMAHSFLDCIGDVDVISDAENIKKLLKIPYSGKAEVSLAVHRVGQTLLLDCLDVPAVISYVSQQTDESIHPQWLYDFYCEKTGIPKDARKLFNKKKKKKDQAKLRHIFSKFLHYSIQDSNSGAQDGSCESPDGSHSSAFQHPRVSHSNNDSTDTMLGVSGISAGNIDLFSPIINEVDSQEDHFVLPQLEEGSSFQHNVRWEFEDIQMLVGSNLPIFGGGKYPAVSLRLRDCGNPINVLTGLDYWLDNLMCNVPEVAMCYHLDGIVQYYDLCKTDELPNLEGSSFSPKVIKDIAQHILSFMKSKCTKEGHTYWLFKATGSDVIKLYDLTSICQQTDDKAENIFTTPVAMLFYRVAQNMMNQAPLNAGEQGTVRQLLNNCITLIDNDRFPEIFTSANFLLSELYSPDDVHALPAISGANEEHGSEKGRENYDVEANSASYLSENCDGQDTTISLKSLDLTKLSAPVKQQDEWIKVSKPLPSNVEGRCKEALSHIVKGLACVKAHLAPDCDSQVEDRNCNTAGSSLSECTSSPPQFPSSTGDETLDSNTPHALVPSYRNCVKATKRKKSPLILKRPSRWQERSTGLLFRKAGAVYHSLACMFNSKGKFGRGLRNCKLAFKCLEASRAFNAQSDIKQGDELLISTMFVCGDSYIMLAKCQENLTVHQEDYLFKSAEDEFIAATADDHISTHERHSPSVNFTRDLEQNMLKSASLYDAALQICSVNTTINLVVDVSKRLGNVKNELGVFYMNKAAGLVDAGAEPSQEERDLWMKSFSHFESGIRTFDALDDSANKALLLSNLGRLMRLCAQAVGRVHSKGTGKRGEFSQEERSYFNKAFEFYNRALRCLAERKKNPEVWDTVTWELSGLYFTMATLLQDYAPLSSNAQEQVEQEVTELMIKALRLCESFYSSSIGCFSQQYSRKLDHRLFSIHHRLASLYHNSYRNQVVDHSKKTARSLAELHYSKASLSIRAEEDPCDYIRIYLEQVALCEYHKTHYGGSSSTIRNLQTALEYLFATKRALEYIGSFKEDKEEKVPTERDPNGAETAETSEKHDTGINFEELQNLVTILESRLMNVLRELVKAHSSLKNKNKATNDCRGLEAAKGMYSVALRSSSSGSKKDIVEKCRKIAETIQSLEEIKRGES